MISITIFEDETISEKIDARIDAMTGPVARQEVSALLAKVRSVDPALFLSLESAMNAYTFCREEAAFVLGVEVATRPSLWLLEQ